MATIITMPRLSDTMTEGTVATWLKKVGDKVSEGDILAEIETDKATMEFESFNEGTLLHIGIPAGETAPVDSLLAIIGKEGEDISGLLNGNTETPKADTPQEQVTPATQAEEIKPTATTAALPKGVVVVTMPRLSDTMTEGTVATWLKKVGDKVTEGDILAEIETDKATMEFESFNEGTLLYIGIEEGNAAPIDSLLAIIGPAGTDVAGIATNFTVGGAATPPDANALYALGDLVRASQPILVSEHVCFNRAQISGQLLHGGDLYPIPYNNASLDVLCQHIDIVQEHLQRPILLENLSAYLENIEHEYSESEFLTLMVQRTGCQLLLDLNNVLINEYNKNTQQTFTPLQNAMAFVAGLPADAIKEIHLAGFTPTKINGQYVDDHAQPVTDECWQLYTQTLPITGLVPTLIEWDNNLPDWSVLQSQAQLARAIAQEYQESTMCLEK